jgi:hypothetical protein
MIYKVDYDVPIPMKRGIELRRTLDCLDVGASIFFPDKSRENLLNGAAHLLPKLFTTRKLKENGITGIRIWRVE